MHCIVVGLFHFVVVKTVPQAGLSLIPSILHIDEHKDKSSLLVCTRGFIRAISVTSQCNVAIIFVVEAERLVVDDKRRKENLL